MSEENLDKERLRQFDAIENEIAAIKKSIKPMQDRLTILKNEKNTIRDAVCSSIANTAEKSAEYEMPNSAFGEPSLLKFAVSERTQPLSADSYGNILLKFFENTDLDEFYELSNAQKATMISEYLLNKDNRNKKISYTAKRIADKQ